MAQVVVIGPGGARTTANDTARPGESESELERLLSGKIPGREGFAGASVQGVRDETYAGDYGGYQPTASESNNGRTLSQGLDVAKGMMSFLPEAVLQEYAKAWVKTGDKDVAVGLTRQTKAWKDNFGKLMRDDGTLIMSEIAFMGVKASYKQTLAEVGVTDFTDFEDEFTDMAVGYNTGDPVSAEEFQARIDLVYAGVKNQIPEVEKLFKERYNIPLDSGTVFAALINPKIQDKILEGDIATLQLQAQATSRGFTGTFQNFERLRKLGLGVDKAGELYRTAGAMMQQAKTIGRELDLSTLEDYAVGDITAAKRVQRIQSELASTQGVQLGAAKKDKQITGLIAD